MSFLSRNLIFSRIVRTYTTNQIVTTSEQKQAIPSGQEEELDDLYKRVVIEVRGHDPSVLESYETFVKQTSNELDLNLKCIRTPFRFIERWTILKSRFGNRKHMRQYEMRTHFKEFEFVHLTGSTCSTLLEYIQRNLPEGLAMHVKTTKMLDLTDVINLEKN